MVSLIPDILLWARRHRPLVIAAAAALTVLSPFAMRGLTFDTDVLALLPRDGQTVPAFRSFAGHFGGLDDLYVVFTAPEGHHVDDYESQIDGWIAKLRAAPEILRVDTGTFDRTRDLGWLADRQLLLLGPDALDAALRRLRGEEMRPALAARRDLLALPSADVADLVRNDPLGLFDLLRGELGGAQAGLNLGVTEGGYVTADGRSRLLIARPARPAFDAAFSRSLAATLRRIETEAALERADPADEPRPPLTVEYAGGHRIAVETEAVVRRESILNTVGSLALILPVLFVIFRSLWLVLVGPLPSSLALAVVLGALGLAGATLSAAATASAAMLFGLGIDGVVLMYVAHGFASAEGGSEADLCRNLAGPAGSMLLGMWTTAATFYGLAFVDFPSLQQLGTLIGHSMLLCGVLTLVLVPALLPRTRARAPRPPLRLPRFASWVQRRRAAIRIGAVIVTVALAAAAAGVRIDPTLDRLRSVTPGAVALERLGPRFNLPSEVYLIVQRGPSLQPLLESNERLAAGVRRELPSLALHPASVLLPAGATQAARASRVRAANLSAAGVTERLEASAGAEGFSRGAFQPFEARLSRLLANGEPLTFEGYDEHGLGNLVRRFVSRDGPGWVIVSYAMPAAARDVEQLQAVVARTAPDAVVTGLPLVNRELARRFLPQFLKGLTIGTALVLVLIVVALRDWRQSLLALTPVVVGLIWAAGLLSLARVSLDLFALFAVVTFVGIGVDYGIHVVHRYRERGAAIAIEELSPVILVAGLITLLGYGTLVSSAYPPLRSIGLVSIVAVVTLSAAALLVLPALLPLQSPAAASPDHAAPAAGGGEVAMRSAALIPAFNEAPHIAAVVGGVLGTVNHVMVVDDGSTDGTAALARAAGAEVLTLPRNSGKGFALRAGLDALAAREFTHVLLLDGDLQHLPDEAPRLVDAARATGADLVLGERAFDRAAMPRSRYYANRIGAKALSGFLGLPLGDTQCGFRVVRLSALRNVRLRGNGYEIETEMLVKLWRRGARIQAVPISAVYAGQVSKLRPVRDTTKTCFLAVYYRYIERI